MRIFIIIIALIPPIAMLLDYIFVQRELDREKALIRWTQTFVVETAEGADRAILFGSEATQEGDTLVWRVEGNARMTPQEGVEPVRYSAVMEETCDNFDSRACWRLVALNIDDRVILARADEPGPAASTPEPDQVVVAEPQPDPRVAPFDEVREAEVREAASPEPEIAQAPAPAVEPPIAPAPAPAEPAETVTTSREEPVAPAPDPEPTAPSPTETATVTPEAPPAAAPDPQAPVQAPAEAIAPAPAAQVAILPTEPEIVEAPDRGEAAMPALPDEPLQVATAEPPGLRAPKPSVRIATVTTTEATRAAEQERESAGPSEAVPGPAEPAQAGPTPSPVLTSEPTPAERTEHAAARPDPAPLAEAVAAPAKPEPPEIPTLRAQPTSAEPARLVAATPDPQPLPELAASPAKPAARQSTEVGTEIEAAEKPADEAQVAATDQRPEPEPARPEVDEPPERADAADNGATGEASSAADSLVYLIQVRLNTLGYGKPSALSPDGVMGPRTRQAIKAFQAENGLPEDGEATPALLAQLDQGVLSKQRGEAPRQQLAETRSEAVEPRAEAVEPEVETVEAAEPPQPAEPEAEAPAEPMQQASPAPQAEPQPVRPAPQVDSVTPARPASLPQIASTTVTGEAGRGAPASRGGEPASSILFLIQDRLNRLGYGGQPPLQRDGHLGPRTERAIQTYQRDHRLRADGRPSMDLLRHMEGQLKQSGQQRAGADR